MRKKRGAELRSEKSPQLKLERIAHILDLSSWGHEGGGVAHAHMACLFIIILEEPQPPEPP